MPAQTCRISFLPLRATTDSRRTNNPYNVQRTAGGSSGGESALIAACGSPFGLGSDAAGSVRLPAHYCGIASLKPTSGRLARTGHVPPAGGWIETLWQIGPMARKVEDLWSLMPVLLGSDGRDHTVVDMPYGNPDPSNSQPPCGIGGNNGIAAPDAATSSVLRRVAETLAREQAIMTECRPPAIDQSYDLE